MSRPSSSQHTAITAYDAVTTTTELLVAIVFRGEVIVSNSNILVAGVLARGVTLRFRYADSVVVGLLGPGKDCTRL